MIRYALKCANAHEFESWFQSSGAYDGLQKSGQVICPDCGSTTIEKLLMAPAVVALPRSANPPSVPQTPGDPSAKAAGAQGGAGSKEGGQSPVPQVKSQEAAQLTKIAQMRAHLEANSEYVGTKFVDEARRMHSGEGPERAIHGEVRLEDAKALIEEGVSIAPLPFLPRRKMN